MNTLIGLIYALGTIGKDLPLDRISTHRLENEFGLLQRILHDCNNFDEFVHAVSRNVVADR
jgi:hypothetical protein